MRGPAFARVVAVAAQRALGNRVLRARALTAPRAGPFLVMTLDMVLRLRLPGSLRLDASSGLRACSGGPPASAEFLEIR
jgi:hypothetical protein